MSDLGQEQKWLGMNGLRPTVEGGNHDPHTPDVVLESEHCSSALD